MIVKKSTESQINEVGYFEDSNPLSLLSFRLYLSHPFPSSLAQIIFL